MADDVVDTPTPGSPAEQRAALERIRQAVLGEITTEDPVLTGMNTLRKEAGIPDREIHIFIDAMAQDIDQSRYATYDELKDYLRGSAVAVANMMLAVMNPVDTATAKPHAKALAEAFQLTNFLRDVQEDITEYDRIYLPQDTLARHGVSSEQIARLEFSPGFADVMKTELEQTERLYRQGVKGIRFLPNECQFAVLLAAVLYAEHHRLIREQNFDVLTNRPSLSMRQRLTVAARTWWHWQRGRDPERVFARVSAVPSANHERTPDDQSLAAATGTCGVTDTVRTIMRPAQVVTSAIGSRFSWGPSE